jgi:hypothetical protein
VAFIGSTSAIIDSFFSLQLFMLHTQLSTLSRLSTILKDCLTMDLAILLVTNSTSLLHDLQALTFAAQIFKLLKASITFKTLHLEIM